MKDIFTKEKLLGEYRVLSYFVCLIVVCFILVGVKAAIKNSVVLYNPGTYTGTGVGVFGGEITVTVTVSKNSIVSVDSITGDQETPDIGGAAIESGELAQQIMDNQAQAPIDGVAGATKTSEGVQAALEDALAQAAVSK